MVRIVQHIWTFQALAAFQHAQLLVLGSGSSSEDRVITVDASDTIGRLRNLQGANTADTLPSDMNDNIHNKDPELAKLWPEYGIKHVLVYTWPEVFQGFKATGNAADALNNANYNWTEADDWIRFVTSHGAKASIQYGGDALSSSPETAGKIGYMITDRYMNGAHGSGFYEALELFDFGAESDLENSPEIQRDYDLIFPIYAAFARGVANASEKAGVGAWGGNRVWTSHNNYSLYDPFVSRFYKDCKKQDVPVKAATFHFTNTQFSFDPYDVRRVTENFREQVLVPAGFPGLPIWMTEYGLNPTGLEPTSKQALEAYNDPAFAASYTIGTAIYAQDAPVDQAFTWPGFGWGGTGAGNASSAPWFEKATNGSAIPLSLAAAWNLQAELIHQTPERIRVEGSSTDGFAVLAGRSSKPDKVQVLLNNYQPNYDAIREITKAALPFVNASTSAYPILQGNGLFNGEQSCMRSNNTKFIVAVCNTFPQARIRDNLTTKYHLIINNLPWGANDSYTVSVQRVGGQGISSRHSIHRGRGETVDLSIPIQANTQHLITVKRTDTKSGA